MKAPKIAAILNVTPDSFSDGGKHLSYHKALEAVHEMVKYNVDVIDIGAESTRPNATVISVREEINRLTRIIPAVYNLVKDKNIKISLDSRNYETIKNFINYIDIINDVTGLENYKIQELVLDNNKQAIVMHSLSIPVKKCHFLAPNINVIEYMNTWLKNKIVKLKIFGFQGKNLIFDPGIGFGLNAQQSIIIVKNIEKLYHSKIKIMLGYSRKSFLAQFGESEAKNRDVETNALTMYLAQKKVDYIRVHNFKDTSKVLKLAKTLW